MLHSSIRLIETFGLVQTMQSLLSVVKKWFCVNITVFLLSMILGATYPNCAMLNPHKTHNRVPSHHPL